MKLKKKIFFKKNNFSIMELQNKKFIRIKKISKMIEKEVTKILQFNSLTKRFFIKEIITISKVDISRDLSFAKIFVTFLEKNSEEKIKNKINILQKNVKLIRKILSKNIQIKSIPKIQFKYDNSLLESIKISNLIEKKIPRKSNLY